jgi:ankyrin repeat protein
MINAPREHLRSFLRKRIGYPRPVGNNNFLNVLFGDGKTFLHGSVLNKKYDITELLLFNEADVNVKEDSRTILHRAAELNDTLLCKIAISYSADLTQFKKLVKP